MQINNKYINSFILFISSALIMIIEIIGAKFLTPFLGGNHIVWITQILITLLCLAIGALVSNNLFEDKKIGISLICSGIILIINSSYIFEIISLLSEYNLIINSIILSIVLYAFPLISLAMIYPIIAKKMTELEIKLGTISFIGTIGSAVGTIITYFIIIKLSNYSILLITAIILILLGNYIGKILNFRITLICMILLLLFVLIKTEKTEDATINETSKMNDEYKNIKESQYENIRLKYGKEIHGKVVNELKLALEKMKIELLDKYDRLYKDTTKLVQTFESMKLTYDQKMYKLVYQSETDCRSMFKSIEKPLNEYVKELRQFEQITNMLTARSYQFECIEMTALKKLYQDFQGFVLANLERDKDYQMVRSQLNTENVAKESLKNQKEELQKQTELAKAKYILEQQRLEEQRIMEQDLKYKLDKSIQKQEEQKENINELKEEIEDLKRPKKW